MVDELCELLAQLTGTVGSCTIRRDEYDVDKKRIPAV